MNPLSNVWDYFTEEQQEKLTKRMEMFTPEELKRLRKESNELIALLRTEMEKGTPPEHPEVIALGKRFKESGEKFNGPDPEIDQAVERFHLDHPEAEVHGIDLKFYQYIQKAKSLS